QDRGAVLHAALLAHALRRAALLRPRAGRADPRRHRARHPHPGARHRLLRLRQGGAQPVRPGRHPQGRRPLAAPPRGPRPALLPRRRVPRPAGQGAPRRQGARLPGGAADRAPGQGAAGPARRGLGGGGPLGHRRRPRRRAGAALLVPGRGGPGHAPAGRGAPVSRGGKRGKGKRPDPAREAFLQGAAAAAAHPAAPAIEVRYCAEDCTHDEPGGMAVVDSGGTVHVDASRRAEPAEWTWAVAHCVLHLGFGHVPAAAGEREQPDPALVAARCTAVARFQATLGGTGTPPGHVPLAFPGSDEESLAARWRRDGVPEGYTRCGTGGPGPDHRLVPWQGFRTPPDWQRAFAHGLTRTMAVAMERAGGRPQGPDGRLRDRRPWERALDWFISSYPLLGGIAAGMELVADADLARAHGIAIAAVDASAGEIYINPFAPHTDEEWRFILAHEMLHAALRHGDRRGPRDPYLFNVAADYVIN